MRFSAWFTGFGLAQNKLTLQTLDGWYISILASIRTNPVAHINPSPGPRQLECWYAGDGCSNLITNIYILYSLGKHVAWGLHLCTTEFIFLFDFPFPRDTTGTAGLLNVILLNKCHVPIFSVFTLRLNNILCFPSFISSLSSSE